MAAAYGPARSGRRATPWQRGLMARRGARVTDEPELDPVSSASRSAHNITWRVQLPADGTFPVYGDHPGQFCIPGQTFCGSFNRANWAGLRPIRILGATFGDGSHPQHWAVVSATGGKAEVLGNSFVGPTDCKAYSGPYCIYPWFSLNSGAISYGVGSTNLGGVDQFAQTATCPETGVFPGATYCDTLVW